MASTADKAMPPASAVAKAPPRNDDASGRSSASKAPGRGKNASVRDKEAGARATASSSEVPVAAAAASAAAARRRIPATSPSAALAAWQQQQRSRPSAPRLPTNPPPAASGKKKRGRPPGSADSKPRKKAAKKSPKPPRKKAAKKSPKPQQYASQAEKKNVEAARKKLDDSRRRCELANEKVEKAEADIARAYQLLDEAKTVAYKADEDYSATAGDVAEVLLLEPNPWNDLYKLLVRFKEREGHINIKRDRLNFHTIGLPPEIREEYRALSWWIGKQRAARSKGTLEHHHRLLLDRVGFDWTPTQGPGPEKWQAKFESLKEYKRIHGDCEVPVVYQGGRTLGDWVRAQKKEYRSAKAGKKRGLTEERTRLLEEIGFVWGVPRACVPWETHFEELCRYKEEFGNANVPWKWNTNRPLASWVNTQRKKYKDLMDGKHAPITAEQIQKLNGIGFQWSTRGKGRYKNEPAVDVASGQVDRLEQWQDSV